jgi:argininosuccinate lyase
MGLWGGRFLEPTDADLKALNDSIGFDIRFYAEDIAGSIAYAQAIQAAGLITPEEASQIVAGLEQVRLEFEEGFAAQLGDEDVHSAVERRLIELVGDPGRKLHTGRSRNDQVATDFRLWVMKALLQIDVLMEQLQRALLEQAEKHVNTIMPGYTHMQPAQPITAAHWLMSFFWMLTRDRERLRESRQRTAVLPLGSGALAGTPFAVDRQALATALGFNRITENSLDGVSDRDFVAEALFIFAMHGTHLSRLAEDVIIYSNPLFGFITLNDRYSTGSSLMPQKRNADPMELARGKAGRLIGNLTGFLTTLKGLPSTYNKDLQEDKEALFDTVDNLAKLLPVVTAMIRTLRLNPEKMRAALGEDMLATDLADYLVGKGMPFREAHHVIGRIVTIAAEEGVNISQISFTDLQDLSPLFESDVVKVFDFTASVARRKAPGGTAPDAVTKQIAQAKGWLEGWE